MKKSLLWCLLLTFSTSCRERTPIPHADDASAVGRRVYSGFTAEEARRHHETIRDSSLIWLNANGDVARFAFLHLSEFQRHSILHRKGTTTRMPRALRPEVGEFLTRTRLGEIPLDEYVRRDEVDGLLILHEGKIVFEDYPRMRPEDLHIWFSVSKTLVSTALGILQDRDLVDVRQPIDFYFEALRGSGWQGVPVVDILSMSSGIDCPEVFTPPESGCYLATRERYGWPDTENALDDPIDAFITLERGKPSGQVFEYTSVNTMLLTLLIEKLSGSTYTEFVEREIWGRMGAESNGMLLSGAYGRDGSWLGVNSTLRDMARYGMLFTPSGRTGDTPVVSDALLSRIRSDVNQNLRTSSWFSDEQKNNGYQWDEIYDDGDFYKHGHGGQGLYISPARDLVIAFFGTKSIEFVEHQLPLVARQLATSDLFDG